MQRLSPAPAIAASLLVAAVSAWWLASLALVPSIVPGASIEISVRATAACITGHWIMIALLTPLWLPRGERIHAALPVLAAACLPLWPMLVMLWAGSGIAALTLAATQLGAAALFGIVLLGRELLARLPIGAATAQPLALALGVSIAAVIWLARTPITDWVQP